MLLFSPSCRAVSSRPPIINQRRPRQVEVAAGSTSTSHPSSTTFGDRRPARGPPSAQFTDGIRCSRLSHQVAHLSRTEAFVVFSQTIPSQSLGFIVSKTPVIELSVAGRDLSIHQSRELLTSDRKQGTTGAGVHCPQLSSAWLSCPR